MNVDFRNGWLWPSFRYNEALVRLMRTFPGRVFDKRTKNWAIPCWHVEEVVSRLTPLGFSLTAAARAYRLQLQAHMQNLARARVTPSSYAGALSDVMYPFQKCGAAFMKIAGSALNADSMGLGKTIQSIAATSNEGAVLVFCPSSNKYGWKKEIALRVPGDVVQVVDGTPSERAEQWKVKAKWFIVNYELLLRGSDPKAPPTLDFKAMMDVEWGAIVADEATRLANGEAKTVKALKRLRAKRKIPLTGTPISNRPDDIWSIIDWISPGYFGTYRQFVDKYAIFDEWGKIVRFQDLQGLAKQLAPLMIRRTMEEVLPDLPKKTVEDVVFDLSKEEQKVYDAVRSGLLAELDQAYLEHVDRKTLAMMPVKMLRLLQATCDIRLLGTATDRPSTKLTVLTDMLRDVIASGEKAICFVQFAEMAKLIVAHLEAEGWAPLVIMGEVNALDRQAAVDAFQADPERRIIVMTDAGALGLNLQAASYVFHFSSPWSVAKLLQREGRAHRIGQTKPVVVYNLVAKNSIDEYVAKLLSKKNRYSVDILEDVERLEAAGLNEEDIKNILRI